MIDLLQRNPNIFLFKLNLKNLEKFDATYFRSKNYFDGDGTQNYLVFQPVYKCFEREDNKFSI